MSFFCTFSEIARTFPARGLSINGSGKKIDVFIGIREATCPQCGNSFSYHPGEHRYIRYRNHREYKICSYKCLRAWDQTKPDPIDKQIENLRKRIEFLREQAILSPDKRTVTLSPGTSLSSLIESTELRLNTALNKKAKEMIAG